MEREKVERRRCLGGRERRRNREMEEEGSGLMMPYMKLKILQEKLNSLSFSLLKKIKVKIMISN